MKIYLTIFILAFALMSSCKKDKQTENNEEPIIEEIETTPEYYIQGKVSGVMLKADYVCSYSGCEFNASNYSSFMQIITMQRTVSDTDQKGWAIHIRNVDYNNWQLPDTLDASDYSNQIQLDLSYYTGNHVSENNYLIDGVVLGENSFQMIVTSKTDEVVQGTFYGELRNGSDTNDHLSVTEGSFKIKIILD